MTERSLGDVSHTNPYTGEPFGDTQTYGRGRLVAADGGEADAVEPDEPDDHDAGGDEVVPADDAGGDTLGEVDHTPPGDAPSANAAYDHTDGGGV